MKQYTIILALLIATSCSSSKPTDSIPLVYPPANPAARNLLLARSVNLGNALEAPNEGEWGVTLEADYFDTIAAAGFTAVRIPIRWSAHVTYNQPYIIEPQFMQRIEWVLDQAERCHLAAVINIHHFNELFSEPTAYKGEFLAIWQQLSAQFSGRDTTLFYEILNEPNTNLTAEIWNDYLQEATDTIRARDTIHTLIIGTAEWGGIAAMEKLRLPEDEMNIIFTFHYYNPFQFTHQGAEWVDGSDAWLGTVWNASQNEQIAIINDLQQVSLWASEHHVPVFMGEFGSYSKADVSSRAAWTYFVSRTAENNGFSWAYWEFCSGFGLYNASAKLWYRSLLDALIP